MAKPAITRERVEKLLVKHGIDLAKEKFVLVGIRGYFRNSMGKPNQNDIGIWDDAFVWIDASNFAAFNGNNDPSRYYPEVATLKTGKWLYKKGWHGYGKPSGHWAFRQAKGVTVSRWKWVNKFYDAFLGDTINIHKGGANSTSSAGCQTLPPAQWDAFREFGYMLLGKHGKETFLYLLVENDGSIA